MLGGGAADDRERSRDCISCCFHACGLTQEACCCGCLAGEPKPYPSCLEPNAVTLCEGHLLPGSGCRGRSCPHSLLGSTASLPDHPLSLVLGDQQTGRQHCQSHNLSVRISKRGWDLESPSALLCTSVTIFDTTFNGFRPFLKGSRQYVIDERSPGFFRE